MVSTGERKAPTVWTDFKSVTSMRMAKTNLSGFLLTQIFKEFRLAYWPDDIKAFPPRQFQISSDAFTSNAGVNQLTPDRMWNI